MSDLLPVAVVVLGTLVLPPEALAPLEQVRTAFDGAETGWSLHTIDVQVDTVELGFTGGEDGFQAVLAAPDEPGVGPWYEIRCDDRRCDGVVPVLARLLDEHVAEDPWVEIAGSAEPHRESAQRKAPNRALVIAVLVLPWLGMFGILFRKERRDDE